MNREKLKSNAKQQIKGKIAILLGITLIISLISTAISLILSFIPFGSLLSAIIVTPAFTLSLVRIYLNVAAGKTPVVNDSFSGFDDFWAAFKVNFLTGLFTFLWSLLFVIPGIIKSYSYSMSMFILAENKGKPALECINESIAMTDGHKMELFELGLSFIGWYFLGIITFGIAFIWIIPYWELTFVNAYHSLKPAVTEAFYSEVSAIPEKEEESEPSTAGNEE